VYRHTPEYIKIHVYWGANWGTILTFFIVTLCARWRKNKTLKKHLTTLQKKT
jgi:uncharacterized membrane protein